MSGSCTNNTEDVINHPGKKAPQVPGSNSSVQVAISSQLIKGQGLLVHHSEWHLGNLRDKRLHRSVNISTITLRCNGD